jgi:hypothetical protein
VLRATGKTDDAASLENEELARALSIARIATNNSEQEAAVLAEEAERVSSATVLAELLAPMLAEHLRPLAPPVAASQVVNAPATASAMPAKPTKAAPPPTENVPSIADFIDGMLSQRPPHPSSPHHH